MDEMRADRRDQGRRIRALENKTASLLTEPQKRLERTLYYLKLGYNDDENDGETPEDRRRFSILNRIRSRSPSPDSGHVDAFSTPPNWIVRPDYKWKMMTCGKILRAWRLTIRDEMRGRLRRETSDRESLQRELVDVKLRVDQLESICFKQESDFRMERLHLIEAMRGHGQKIELERQMLYRILLLSKTFREWSLQVNMPTGSRASSLMRERLIADRISRVQRRMCGEMFRGWKERARKLKYASAMGVMNKQRKMRKLLAQWRMWNKTAVLKSHGTQMFAQFLNHVLASAGEAKLRQSVHHWYEFLTVARYQRHLERKRRFTESRQAVEGFLLVHFKLRDIFTLFNAWKEWARKQDIIRGYDAIAYDYWERRTIAKTFKTWLLVVGPSMASSGPLINMIRDTYDIRRLPQSAANRKPDLLPVETTTQPQFKQGVRRLKGSPRSPTAADLAGGVYNWKKNFQANGGVLPPRGHPSWETESQSTGTASAGPSPHIVPQQERESPTTMAINAAISYQNRIKHNQMTRSTVLGGDAGARQQESQWDTDDQSQYQSTQQQDDLEHENSENFLPGPTPLAERRRELELKRLERQRGVSTYVDPEEAEAATTAVAGGGVVASDGGTATNQQRSVSFRLDEGSRVQSAPAAGVAIAASGRQSPSELTIDTSGAARRSLTSVQAQHAANLLAPPLPSPTGNASTGGRKMSGRFKQLKTSGAGAVRRLSASIKGQLKKSPTKSPT